MNESESAVKANIRDMNNVLIGILMVLTMVNICLHSTGCYLLFCLYGKTNQTLQQLYLINLSCCEVVINLVELMCCAVELISTSTNINEFQKYLDIINLAGNGTVYYLSISYVNLDRLFDILLNIRYPVYWSEQKAKYLITCTWSVGVIVAVVFCLSYQIEGTEQYHVLFTYFFPTLNSAFLVIALATYSFIYHKYKQTRIMPTQKVRRRGVTVKPPSTASINPMAVYRNSRFHIPVLIVTSFVVLKVIPDLVAQIIGCGNKEKCKVILYICFMSHALTGIASAYIYVFMEKSVKRLLQKRIRRALSKWRPCESNRMRRKGISNRIAPSIITMEKSEDFTMQNIPEWQRDVDVREGITAKRFLEP